jgi:hypothetical protein
MTRASLLDLAPLGNAAAVNAEVVHGGGCSVRSLDTAGVSILPSHLSRRLPAINLCRHAHLGAGETQAS